MKKRVTTYRYVCLERPPGPGAVPREGLLDSYCMAVTAPNGYAGWGYVDYDRKLTPKEQEHYDLEFWMEVIRLV